MRYLIRASRFFIKSYIFALVLFVVLIAAKILSFSEISSAEAASWVQAIGSIISIWGAFAIARFQKNKEEALIRQVNEEKQIAYSSVVDMALNCTAEIEREVQKSKNPENFSTAWETYYDSYLASYITALELVPVYELSNPADVSKHIHVTSVITVLHKEISKYLEDPQAYRAYPEALYEHVKILCKWARNKPEI